MNLRVVISCLKPTQGLELARGCQLKVVITLRLRYQLKKLIAEQSLLSE